MIGDVKNHNRTTLELCINLHNTCALRPAGFFLRLAFAFLIGGTLLGLFHGVCDTFFNLLMSLLERNASKDDRTLPSLPVAVHHVTRPTSRSETEQQRLS